MGSTACQGTPGKRQGNQKTEILGLVSRANTLRLIGTSLEKKFSITAFLIVAVKAQCNFRAEHDPESPEITSDVVPRCPSKYRRW